MKQDVGTITDFADLTTNHLSQVAAGAVILDGLGNTLTIVGVSQSSLGMDDFAF